MILLATGVPGVAQRPWEPQMGANAIGRLQTQPDPLRMSMQVEGSPFDSVRRRQTPESASDFLDTEKITVGFPGPVLAH